MKIVVTGALGHIGSALIRKLPFEFPDVEIIMIDNLYTQRYCSLFNLPKGNYKFIRDDVRTCAIPDCDVIVHLAAYTEPHAKLDWSHNLEATKNVVRQYTRVIFPSTMSVLPKPQTEYAAMKYLEEVALNRRFCTILRLGNLFGPSPGMRFHTAVSKLCWQAAMGEPLTIWKTALDQLRPYLDLIDVVNAICFIIKHDHFNGQTFNLVSENATIGKVVRYIDERIKTEISIIESPSMNDISYPVCAAKIEMLGFKFTGDLRRGIHATLDLLCASRS